MNLQEGMLTRHSVRGFKDTPVSKELLIDVLRLGTTAVSALNSQPWEFVVLTGELKDKIANANVECFMSGAEEDLQDPVLTGRQRQGMVGVGKQLLTAMDIKREDKEGRIWWSQRGYKFFDAPAVILICMDKACDEVYHRIDIGALCQNIALAAHSYGLGTCVELQAVSYQKGVREYLPQHADKNFIIGIAIGYPDENFPANSVVSARDDVEELTTWYGFDE
ncbi:MAG: nitroreductase [Eubacterium sp.]|nr:nitroreductase [Candidatus Colimonas fimequi]